MFRLLRRRDRVPPRGGVPHLSSPAAHRQGWPGHRLRLPGELPQPIGSLL